MTLTVSAKRQGRVDRPLKRAEYEILFLTRQAEKGWQDCLATREYQEATYPRYQYKITDGGRLWYIVRPAVKGTKVVGHVLLERCEPGHPKETER